MMMLLLLLVVVVVVVLEWTFNNCFKVSEIKFFGHIHRLELDMPWPDHEPTVSSGGWPLFSTYNTPMFVASPRSVV